MMVYFDTNIYIYAFCQNVDNALQKELSQKLLKQYASSQELVISEVILYEFAFISKKLDEDIGIIQKNLEWSQDVTFTQVLSLLRILYYLSV